METRLQIVSSSGSHPHIKAHWLYKTEKATGKQIFYHPECEIWVSGRNTAVVQHVIMQALQDKKLRVSKLLFVKGGLK